MGLGWGVWVSDDVVDPGVSGLTSNLIGARRRGCGSISSIIVAIRPIPKLRRGDRQPRHRATNREQHGQGKRYAHPTQPDAREVRLCPVSEAPTRVRAARRARQSCTSRARARTPPGSPARARIPPADPPLPLFASTGQAAPQFDLATALTKKEGRVIRKAEYMIPYHMARCPNYGWKESEEFAQAEKLREKISAIEDKAKKRWDSNFA